MEAKFSAAWQANRNKAAVLGVRMRPVEEGEALKNARRILSGSHFIEGPVTAAGVNAAVLSGFGRFPGQTPAFAGALGDLDAVVQSPLAAGRFNGLGIVLCAVPASRRRVDDKQMLHLSLSASFLFL